MPFSGKFFSFLMSSCCNQIKDCGIDIDYDIGGYTEKLQVMDVGVNKPFRGYIQQEYQKFMVGNVENTKVCREDVVQWIQNGWEMVKVETITMIWAKHWIEIQNAVF